MLPTIPSRSVGKSHGCGTHTAFNLPAASLPKVHRNDKFWRVCHERDTAAASSSSSSQLTMPGRRTQARIVASTQPETEEQRSPLDAPQEWEAPQPSRRPDIFPEFEKMERVFLPKPMPGDPEMPDEEADESAKRTLPGDPDPEQKPGEPPEVPETPSEPGGDPERTDIPNIPD